MKKYRFYVCIFCLPSPDPQEKKGGFCKDCVDVEAESESDAQEAASKIMDMRYPNRVKGKNLDKAVKELKTNKREFFKLMGVEEIPGQAKDSCC